MSLSVGLILVPDVLLRSFCAVGHFLLTNLLIEMLKKSAPSRIVNVSSLAHTRATCFDFDNIKVKKENYNSRKTYSYSKLANIYFTKQLANRLEGELYMPFALLTFRAVDV